MALKRNLIANFFGQGWAILRGLVFVPLYIKYLGIEAYGRIGLFALLQVQYSPKFGQGNMVHGRLP